MTFDKFLSVVAPPIAAALAILIVFGTFAAYFH